MRKFWRSNIVLVAVVALIGLSLSASSAQGQERDILRFRNQLLGTEEVSPTDPTFRPDPDARGTARVRVHTDNNVVCFTVDSRNVGTPNRGHIHEAARGTNGPIVVAFFELVGVRDDMRNEALEKGALEDCVQADAAVVDRIEANPANFYVNLHNARYPGGAVRCQLV